MGRSPKRKQLASPNVDVWRWFIRTGVCGFVGLKHSTNTHTDTFIDVAGFEVLQECGYVDRCVYVGLR